MRAIRNTLAAVLLVTLACISVVGIMACFPTFGGRFTRVHDYGSAVVAVWRTHGLLWLWFGLLVSTLATLIMSLALARKRAMVEVEMDDGRVVILETAIRKYVRQALTGVPGVTGHQIRLKQTRKGLHVDIFAQVRTHERLPEIESAIINKVRSAMSDDLGIRSISAVHVYIRDFEIAAKPQPQPLAPPLPVTVPEEVEETGAEQPTYIQLRGLDRSPAKAEIEPVAREAAIEDSIASSEVTAAEESPAGPAPASPPKGWGLFRRKKAPAGEEPQAGDNPTGPAATPSEPRHSETPGEDAGTSDQPPEQREPKDGPAPL